MEQRVVDLVRDVARIAVAICDRERLHQVPAREVRGADIAELAAAHQLIECRQRLLDRGVVVLAVELEQIDVIGAESPQRGLDRDEQMLARGAVVVGAVAGREGRLGRDQDPIALAGDCLAEDLLREAIGVDIGGVEHRDATIEAQVDQPRRAFDVRGAPRPEEVVTAAECAGAEAESGHA
jgi:hypothetical protein